jgi:hypothetical protein
MLPYNRYDLPNFNYLAAFKMSGGGERNIGNETIDNTQDISYSLLQEWHRTAPLVQIAVYIPMQQKKILVSSNLTSHQAQRGMFNYIVASLETIPKYIAPLRTLMLPTHLIRQIEPHEAPPVYTPLATRNLRGAWIEDSPVTPQPFQVNTVEGGGGFVHFATVFPLSATEWDRTVDITVPNIDHSVDTSKVISALNTQETNLPTLESAADLLERAAQTSKCQSIWPMLSSIDDIDLATEVAKRFKDPTLIVFEHIGDIPGVRIIRYGVDFTHGFPSTQ